MHCTRQFPTKRCGWDCRGCIQCTCSSQVHVYYLPKICRTQRVLPGECSRLLLCSSEAAQLHWERMPSQICCWQSSARGEQLKSSSSSSSPKASFVCTCLVTCICDQESDEWDRPNVVLILFFGQNTLWWKCLQVSPPRW